MRDCIAKNLARYNTPDKALLSQYLSLADVCRAAVASDVEVRITPVGSGSQRSLKPPRPPAASKRTVPERPATEGATPTRAAGDGEPAAAPAATLREQTAKLQTGEATKPQKRQAAKPLAKQPAKQVKQPAKPQVAQKAKRQVTRPTTARSPGAARESSLTEIRAALATPKEGSAFHVTLSSMPAWLLAMLALVPIGVLAGAWTRRRRHG